jgi:tRNA pseudouridine55 synthase
MNGIINVYKEQGYTSHDVVAKLRGILHMRKIGHTGTLDPEAQGVLPVCIGKGTGLCGMITDWNKTYEAVMLLGTRTDTQDTTGVVLEKNEVNVDEIQIMEACNSFIGEYYQIPPMYSALKFQGHKLYELARQGIEVERAARKVTIKSLHVNEIHLNDEEKTVTLTVECSKGTYIRTLCEDIGKKLGCGACMKQLVRTRVGSFSIDDSLTLDQIEELVSQERIGEAVTDIDEMFYQYRKLTVLEEYHKLLYNGNKIPMEAVGNLAELELPFGEGERYRVYDGNGHFMAVYAYADDRFVPVKMFLTETNA